MLRTSLKTAVAAGVLAVLATPALAQSSSYTPTGFWDNYIAGGWSLELGATAAMGPKYEGAKDFSFLPSPIISLSRQGKGPAFTSRNDNPGLGLLDNGFLRIGPVGKILFERDGSTDDDLKGLKPVRWGGELGIFADIYPTEWLRLRAELRHGIRSHHGLVADIAADAFYDIAPDWRISGGPRVSLATRSYFDAYYGVNLQESLASGLSPYSPGGGLKSVGVGGALTWKTTDKITTSAFAEYSRLTGPASKSSLVKERGSPNQFTIGVSASYRFDFNL
ncbi:MipA/OmpV family protein [Labrys portucalensis]|uniref:MipA/OmpV family protein n=1 Tax=Labrys neptuniae TaxID=376174 RepID=A0ABV6ZC36_9HYPH